MVVEKKAFAREFDSHTNQKLLITFEYNRRWGIKVLNPDLPQK